MFPTVNHPEWLDPVVLPSGPATNPLRVLLRPSTRARRLILRLLNRDTLEVVLPPGAHRSQVAPFLAKHAAWIRNAQERQTARHEGRGIPPAIHLPAISEHWQVRGVFTAGNTVELTEVGADRGLELRGSIDRPQLWSAMLQAWLRRRATDILVPWLDRLAEQTGLRCRKVAVRLQRSRWGSCSSRRHINLNARLLLVAPELVSYLIVHELCHTRELNHSNRFWNLVERHCPDYEQLDRRLNRASRELPFWSQFRAE
ncbi:MAG TPA: SprT family zinc-dependent metalloprotease [Chthoniobacterales bacterium]